jgi:hypothetical protein
VAAAAVLPALIPAVASAATSTPWEPDPTPNQEIGTLQLFNSGGTQVTSGSDLTHLFDFAEASTADADGGTKAAIEFALPQAGDDVQNPTSGTANPGTWPVSSASASTVFPVSTPASLASTANPVATIATTDAGGNLQSFINSNSANSGSLANIYQIRLFTSGAGGVGTVNDLNQYWAADVLVDPTANTWTELYPDTGAAVKSTTTTLTASPAGGSSQGGSVTLTATVTASDSTHPAGSVEFDQDGQEVGTANTETTGGVAALTTSALLPSAPSGTVLTAKFTATDAADFTGSTSANLNYTVNPVAKKPTLSGTHKVGAKETCNEGTLDFGVTATYAWKASGKSVGSGKVLTIPGSAYKKSLTCTVSVKDGSGPSSSSTSSAVSVTVGAKLKATSKPKLSGTHKHGKTEKVSKGKWSPAATSYTYQWLLNGKAIKHATKSSFKIPSKDKNKKLSCKVTAKKTGYTSGTSTTSSVKVE